VPRLDRRPARHARRAPEVDRAKADGRWDAAYGEATTREVPADLAEALAAVPRAEAMFAILTQQNKFAILYRLQTSKRPETRTKWITRYVDELSRGETPHPQKRRLD
jgi:uncharacterized protein YdeI (YjbR/CyaY-like superfamily)